MGEPVSLDLADFEVLSFDCYGTLIDWEAGMAAVLGPWARRHDPSITDEDVLEAYARQESVVESEAPATRYPDVLRESFRRTGAALGHEVTEADADALATSVPDWPAFPDSADALQRLKRRYKLIILSNVDRASFAGSNRRLGVAFDEILTAEDIGSYKPDPANFAALRRRVDEMRAGKLLHVAQSLYHDHVPAKAAGLPTVWINRRHAKPGWGATPGPGVDVTPDLEFPSLAVFAHAVEDARGRPPQQAR
jgi:2-haloalkanoic acid dehalogenase type II